MLYFVHHFVVVSLVQRGLGIVMTSWWVYWLANALLMAALFGLTAAWLAGKRARCSRFTVDASAAA